MSDHTRLLYHDFPGCRGDGQHAGAAALAEDLEALRQEISEKMEAALNGKTNIVITREDLPLSQRKKKTIYFVVKDSHDINPGDSSLRVSPNMGIKVL